MWLAGWTALNILGSSVGVVNSLVFYFTQHRLRPLAVFTSGMYFLHNGRWWQWIHEVTAPTLKAFLRPTVRVWLAACVIGCQKMHFFDVLMVFWSAGKQSKDTFFPILHHLSPVILANVTVVAFALLQNSRFNFYCYAQCKPTECLLRIRPRTWNLLQLLARMIM